jgi:hypothetical protein
MKGGSLGIVLGDFFRPRPRVENPWLQKILTVKTGRITEWVNELIILGYAE